MCLNSAKNIGWLRENTALLHFRTPPFVIDDSSWKNVVESFTVALTLTLGGYESAIALKIFDIIQFSWGKTGK